MKEYYGCPGVRDTCHAVKGEYGKSSQRDAECIMADYFCGMDLSPRDIIVPAPQHIGYADYTLRIAERVSKETGAQVLDILRRIPGTSLYEQKKQQGESCLRMYRIGNVALSGRIFFLDNVISTGKTFLMAKRLLGRKLIPMIFARS